LQSVRLPVVVVAAVVLIGDVVAVDVALLLEHLLVELNVYQITK
jgi:hypothetical protein